MNINNGVRDRPTTNRLEFVNFHCNGQLTLYSEGNAYLNAAPKAFQILKHGSDYQEAGPPL